jgi:hypothetical protein
LRRSFQQQFPSTPNQIHLGRLLVAHHVFQIIAAGKVENQIEFQDF